LYRLIGTPSCCAYQRVDKLIKALPERRITQPQVYARHEVMSNGLGVLVKTLTCVLTDLLNIARKRKTKKQAEE
jgi:hypothetical protein